MTNNPTPKQIRQALKDALGNKAVFVKGSATRGRPWSEHSKGLAGHVFHHTANPNAKGDRGAPSLQWCINASGDMPFCNAVVGRNGNYYVLSLGSCWHSGYGGPWPSRGFASAADNYSAKAFWGVEIDDPGVGRTITDAQIESAAKAAAALSNLVGWDPYALITHGDWTDAGPFLMDRKGRPESGFGPYRGRKADTNRNWYNAYFWRKQVAYFQLPKISLAAVKQAAETSTEHASVALVAAALTKEGFSNFGSGLRFGSAKRQAYKHWQQRIGLAPTGIPTRSDLKELGSKTGLFLVVD